jgi:isocitrate dehydrogenase (NAD+)
VHRGHGVSIRWDEQEAGLEVMAKLVTPIADSVIESCRRTRVALKAPITTPVGTGFRSVNVYLRQALDLYACVRPCKLFRGVRTFFSGTPVDLVIVRENTESLYFGCEFEQGKPETAESLDDQAAQRQDHSPRFGDHHQGDFDHRLRRSSSTPSVRR